jgi:hypothetical protein
VSTRAFYALTRSADLTANLTTCRRKTRHIARSRENSFRTLLGGIEFLTYVRLLNGAIQDPIYTATLAYSLKALVNGTATTGIVIVTPAVTPAAAP